MGQLVEFHFLFQRKIVHNNNNNILTKKKADDKGVFGWVSNANENWSNDMKSNQHEPYVNHIPSARVGAHVGSIGVRVGSVGVRVGSVVVHVNELTPTV